VFLALLGVLLLPAVPGPIGPAPLAAEGTPPDQVLVKFREGVSPAERQDTHAQKGGKVASVIPGIDVDVVAVPQGKGAEKARAYEEDPRILYAEVDAEVHVVGTTDDTLLSKQWGLFTVKAPDAWGVTTGSAEVKIAVLDTGVKASHPDLAGKVVVSTNFSSSATTDDLYGHGTHVAGIAAAATYNATGVAGLGYDSTVLNVKVLNDSGSGSWSGVANGIIYAADNGAKVINMSLGSSSASSTLESAVNYAWNKGVVVVAAAGNNGTSSPFYPAYYQNVIAVAATDSGDILASFSNRGDWVDVAAPGVSIYSTVPTGVPTGTCSLVNVCDASGYTYLSGTSMASPHVAGLAALLFTLKDSTGKGLLNDAVRSCIQANADKIGVITGILGGRINAYRAVTCSPAAPTTGTITGTVTDSATALAIAGATVSIIGLPPTSTTNASGAYTFTSVSQGTYTVTASASSYTSASQSVSVTAGTTSIAPPFSLTPQPPSTSPTVVVNAITYSTSGGSNGKKHLLVTVSTKDNQGTPGNPVVGASVSIDLLFNSTVQGSYAGTTGTTGTVTFTRNNAPLGTYTTTVTAVTAAGLTWDNVTPLNSFTKTK